MKRKLILLPITLTALTPAIGLVGCGNTDTPELETHIVTFSAGDHGSLEGEATITIEGNETTLGEITKPTVVADETHGYFFDHWDHDDSYVINDDVTITALYQDLSEYTIDMDEIETIIDLEGVEFAQSKNKTSAIIEGEVVEVYENCEFSPTVYHDECEELSFEEKYVYSSPTGYQKQERLSKDGDWQIAEADSSEFLTPESGWAMKS